MNARIVLVGSALAGWTLIAVLDAALKAGILLALGALVVLCMRRSSAEKRHLVWFCALAGALVLPLGFKVLPEWRVLPSWMRWEEMPRLFTVKKAESTTSPVGNEIPRDFNDSGNTYQSSHRESQSESSGLTLAREITPDFRLHAKWVIWAWAGMACLMLLPISISALALRKRTRNATRVSTGPLHDAVNCVRSELGMTRPISLLLGKNEDMPMVWGIFHGHLLLPEAANAWSAERLRVVLLHEVSHLRRRDPLALLVAHLALALHWFNPLAWLAVWRLRVEQEIACDDTVLRHGVLASDYAAEMLAASTHFRTGCLVRYFALTMARPSGLETRIVGILDASRNRRSITRRLAVISLGLATVAAIPLAILRAGEPERIQRGRILDRNGIVLAQTPDGGIRTYPFKQLAAHRLGYLGKSGDEGNYHGMTGAERSHDAILAQGKDVTLTMDFRIQSAVEDAMHQAGVERGAAVIIDCMNGDLLANASFPAYDPNEFIPKITKEKFKLFNTPLAPLLDRTVRPTVPGSAFKLVTALAACRSGRAGETYDCAGFITFGNARLACWIGNLNGGSHGNLDLRDAISASCNCYFAQAANHIGIQPLEQSGHLLGFGEISGSGYPNEKPGVFPGPLAELNIEMEPKWTPHQIAMTSLGQGFSQATSLQIAVLAAAMGNGENVWVPRLTPDAPPQIRTQLLQQGWKPADLAMIRSAMRDNVMKDRGTAIKARSEKIQIAGLSATGSTHRRGNPATDAWFFGYAPADAPRYAIAILVEDGRSGGSVCGPIARDILESICLGSSGD